MLFGTRTIFMYCRFTSDCASSYYSLSNDKINKISKTTSAKTRHLSLGLDPCRRARAKIFASVNNSRVHKANTFFRSTSADRLHADIAGFHQSVVDRLLENTPLFVEISWFIARQFSSVRLHSDWNEASLKGNGKVITSSNIPALIKSNDKIIIHKNLTITW